MGHKVTGKPSLSTGHNSIFLNVSILVLIVIQCDIMTIGDPVCTVWQATIVKISVHQGFE